MTRKGNHADPLAAIRTLPTNIDPLDAVRNVCTRIGSVNELRILRLPAVIEKSGMARSTVYKQISDGLWVRPIALGPRSVGFVQYEVEAILSARVMGASNEQIRVLVTALEAARQQLGCMAGSPEEDDA
jgi:prophage regulatory protein